MAGDDTYFVDDAGDTLTEASGQGSDRVRTLVDHVLGANFENLTVDGTADVQAGGNSLAG